MGFENPVNLGYTFVVQGISHCLGFPQLLCIAGWLLVLVPAFLVLLYTKAFWEATAGVSSAWTYSTHVGNQNRVHGFWIYPRQSKVLQAFGD